MIKLKILDLIAEDAAKCTACDLHKSRTKSVFGDGTPYTNLVFCGEGPGADENLQGKPFVGRSGKLLTKMIEAMGIKREQVYILNICKCRPPNNRKPELIEINACKKYLEMQLSVINPHVIVALGTTAVEGLLGPGEGITKRRGKWENLIIDNHKIAVMPTLHPSYLLRNPAAKEMVKDDLSEVLRMFGGINIENQRIN